MATDRGGRIVDEGPGFVERVFAGARFAVTGDKSIWDGWFGPMHPLPVVAQPEATGRQMDYPVGVNVQSRPRAYEPVSFEQLRALADNYDLLRLVIETRKDQIEKLNWAIKVREDGPGSDGRAKELTSFFRSPDKLHTWNQWLRALLEDLFVIDAATAYCHRTKGGDPYAVELIDGATIMRVVDSTGRTPIDDVAYQQILKGVKAAEYTRNELIYMPRNVRTNRFYGYGPVEQIIMSVNIAIRRQLNQLQYYTEGNAPDLIIGLPKEWAPAAVREFQNWWNSLITSEDQRDRRKTRFVPEGLKVIDTKDRTLKDEYDEWLARVVCYAFSVSPQAFVQQMNRATAQTAMEEAKQEGLQPLMKWFKAFMDSVLERFFGETDYEFVWTDEEAINPLERAQIQEIHVRNGIRSVEEVREKDLKLKPERRDKANEAADAPTTSSIAQAAPQVPGAASATSQEAVQDTALNGTQITSLLSICEAVASNQLPKPSAIAMLTASFPKIPVELIQGIINPIEQKTPEPPPVALPAPNQASPSVQGLPPKAEEAVPASTQGTPKPKKQETKTVAAEKAMLKAKTKVAAQVSMDRPAAQKTEKALRAAWKKWLRAQANPLASQITSEIGKMAKGEKEDIDAQVAAVMKQLGFKNSAVIKKTTQEMTAALYKDAGYEALKKIAAEAADMDQMLSMVNERGAKWAEANAASKITEIEDATKEFIKTDVRRAIEEGLSTQELADVLADSYGFSDERASTIARTELSAASIKGTVDGYKESGVVEGLSWLVSQDDTCDECMEMADVPGTLEDGFNGEFPPLHPNCRCDVVAEVSDLETIDEEKPGE